MKRNETAEDAEFWESLEKAAREVESWPEWKRKAADAWWESVKRSQDAITESLNYCGHCGRNTGGRTCFACYGG